MLSTDPQGGLRPLLGKLLVGGTAFAALALTVSTLPNRVVFAAEPETAAAPTAIEKKVERVVIVHADGDDTDTDAPADGAKREVKRIVIHGDGDAEGKPRVIMFDGKNVAFNADEIRIPSGANGLAASLFGTNSDDLRATLKEQGIDDAKADAIVKQMEQKRAEALRKQFSWAEGHAKLAEVRAKRAAAIAIASCPPEQGQRVMIDRESGADGKAKVRMVGCGGAEIAREKQVEALTRARDRMAAQKDGHGMSAEIRASVVADLDKAIAELEAEKK